MHAGSLINGVLRGVLGARPKRSHGALRFLTGRGGGLWSNPQVMITAAGLAWGVYETLQGERSGTAPADAAAPPDSAGPRSVGHSSTDAAAQRAAADPVAPAAAAPPMPGPPPLPHTLSETGAKAASDDALRMLRLAISAAGADGNISEQERAAVLRHATDAGAASLVERELQSPRPLKEIVQGVNDPATAATLYVLAFTILRADERITGAERIYLAQLANLLHLDADTVQALENDTGERIDALGDQGQLGG